MEEYKINLLKLVSKYDVTDILYWNEDLEFHIMCNDLFYWAVGDAVEIVEQADVDLLELTIKDCQEVQLAGEVYAKELYCARKYKMRPQGAYYEHINKNFWPLFDACGPEREVNTFNPKPQPKE